MMDQVTMEAVKRRYPDGFSDPDGLVTHVQVSKNFGCLGGWLRCEFLAYPNGDPTGHTVSRVEYPPAPPE